MKLTEYIEGKRKGKEANRLERQAMNDPFLQDALDGFDDVTGDHTQVIARLEKRFSQSETPSEIDVKSARKRLSIVEQFIYVAASFLLIVGFSAIFLWDRDSESNPEAVVAMEELQPEAVVAMEESQSEQVVAMEKLQPEQVIAMEKLQPEQVVAIELSQSEQIIAMEESQSEQIAAVAVQPEAKVSTPAMDVEFVVAMEELAPPSVAADEILQDARSARAASSKKSASPNYDAKTVAESAKSDPRETTVKVSFFIDKTGKPTNIEFEENVSEETKKAVEKMLAASPAWKQRNKRVTMTITLDFE
ncbi:MAG: hypothetical protein FWG84_03265 [Bacteroidales bacterium]|nr:hypothetical protein [Bacteroidales bacterium]